MRQIYLGTISNWKQIGGLDKEIIVVHKAEGRSTLDVFLEYFKLQNHEVSADVITGENQQGIKTVATNVSAIGYVSIGAALVERDRGVPIEPINLGAISATVENVISGTYPITRSLNLVTLGEAPKEVTEFIKYCQSAHIRDLVEEANFVYLQN